MVINFLEKQNPKAIAMALLDIVLEKYNKQKWNDKDYYRQLRKFLIFMVSDGLISGNKAKQIDFEIKNYYKVNKRGENIEINGFKS